MSSLEERLNAPPANKWDPFKNQDDPVSILGVIEDRYTFHSDKYEDSETLIVRNGEAGHLVYFSGAVLRGWMEDNDPQVGGRIGIKFLGTQERRSDGKPYPTYHVVYEPPLGEQQASKPVEVEGDEAALSDLAEKRAAVVGDKPSDDIPF